MSTRDIYRLGFEFSPIILTNGIAQLLPGGMLPIIAITQASNFTLGLLQGTVDTTLDDYFARFAPLPGATLISQDAALYPFANQTIAANATVTKPNIVSLSMTCPVQMPGGYFSKLLTMTSLKQVLDKHNASGGTYIVATPSYLYANCLLGELRDVSNMGTHQVQTQWQWDFIQPLITLDAAAEVFNSLMGKLASGVPISGAPSWSGIASSIGSTVSGAAPSLLTSAQNLIGAGVNGVKQAAVSIYNGIL